MATEPPADSDAPLEPERPRAQFLTRIKAAFARTTGTVRQAASSLRQKLRRAPRADDTPAEPPPRKRNADRPEAKTDAAPASPPKRWIRVAVIIAIPLVALAAGIAGTYLLHSRSVEAELARTRSELDRRNGELKRAADELAVKKTALEEAGRQANRAQGGEPTPATPDRPAGTSAAAQAEARVAGEKSPDRDRTAAVAAIAPGGDCELKSGDAAAKLRACLQGLNRAPR